MQTLSWSLKSNSIGIVAQEIPLCYSCLFFLAWVDDWCQFFSFWGLIIASYFRYPLSLIWCIRLFLLHHIFLNFDHPSSLIHMQILTFKIFLSSYPFCSSPNFDCINFNLELNFSSYKKVSLYELRVKKYAFWVTSSPCSPWGKAKPSSVHYNIRDVNSRCVY